MDFSDLDELTTHELHHRAVRLAEHRLDAEFFWRLLEYIPMAEVIADAGNDAEADVKAMARAMNGHASRGGRLDEALRPVYIDYLEKHS